MNYSQAIENIAKKNGLKNNYQIATYLGMTAKDLNRLREDGGSPIAKLKLMDKLGYQWAKEALKTVLPEKAYQKYIEMDKAITKKKLSKEEEADLIKKG